MPLKLRALKEWMAEPNTMLYLYCITRKTPEISDLTGGHLLCIPVSHFFVFAKAVSPEEFSEENLKKNLNDLAWVDLHVRNHIRVIGEIMKSDEVIPFKFGTIFLSEDNLRKFIHDYDTSLTENFTEITGKEEWAVKLYCNREEMIRHLGEVNDEIRTLRQTMEQSAPGKAFLLRRKIAELTEQEVYRVMKTYGQSCFAMLEAVSVKTRVHNLLPKEATERQDEMILNLSFLVEKNRVSDFLAETKSAGKKYENTGIIPEVTGPWPPFSFISIKEPA